MRVLFDHQAMQFRYGGVARYIAELACHLNQMPDTEASVFSAWTDCEYLDESVGSRRKLPKLPMVPNLIEKLNSRSWRKHCAKLDGIDICHLSYFSDTIVPSGAKRVVTVYDMIHELYLEGEAYDRVSASKRLACEKADLILAISENTKKDLVRFFGVPNDKVKVVHIAAALDLSCVGKNDHGDYILYVGGRHSEYKGFEKLLEVYAVDPALRDKFRLIAFGGGAWSEKELEMMDKLGIRNRVEQIGGADELLTSLYSHARCLVYPSVYEGFGIPPLEAMMFGTPAVTSLEGSLPEVVGDASVSFDAEDDEDLTRALHSAVFDDALREEKIAAGYEQAKKFSWERCARETRAAYESIL